MTTQIDFKLLEETLKSFDSEHFLNRCDEGNKKTGKSRNLMYVKCDFCEEIFKTQKSLNRHQTEKHTHMLKHKCSICTAPFLHMKDLQNHMKFHEKELVKCEHCEQTFEKLRDFEKHNVAEHCKNLDGDYECRKCQSVYQVASELEYHLRNSNCIQKLKLWCCNLCDKTFTTKGSLGTHKKIHQGKRDFECVSCQKSFRTNSDLQRHANRTHTKVKFYTCSICNKNFYDKTDLHRHIRRHGKVRPIYECSVCTKRFYVPRAFASHKKKHEKVNDRPYKCEFCPRLFKERKYLKRHMMKVCRNLPKEVENALTTVETVIKEESSSSCDSS